MAKRLPQNAIIINGKVYEFVDIKDYQTNTDCEICDLKKVCFEYYEELLCFCLFDEPMEKTFKCYDRPTDKKGTGH